MGAESSAVAIKNSRAGFTTGSIIGILGGLVGLGGAEFRLPILVGYFRFPTLEAIILNKAISLVVVASALAFRTREIPLEYLFPHISVVLNLLSGSLVGAWWAAGKAMDLPPRWLNGIVFGLLSALAILMLSEAWFGYLVGGTAMPQPGTGLFIAGFAAGIGIGVVAALLGVAGGELLIPTIVLLYGLNIKTAGSLSLAVSLPTMITGFARYRRSEAFSTLARERRFFFWMATGSICGAALGGAFVGMVPTRVLTGLLGVILFLSAIKTFRPAFKLGAEHAADR